MSEKIRVTNILRELEHNKVLLWELKIVLDHFFAQPANEIEIY